MLSPDVRLSASFQWVEKGCTEDTESERMSSCFCTYSPCSVYAVNITATFYACFQAVLCSVSVTQRLQYFEGVMSSFASYFPVLTKQLPVWILNRYSDILNGLFSPHQAHVSLRKSVPSMIRQVNSLILVASHGAVTYKGNQQNHNWKFLHVSK